MRAVVVAYHEMGCAGIEALLRNGFDIAAVFTHRDDAGEALWFRSVAELCVQHGLPVFAPDDVNHPLMVEKIRRLEPDILFSFYYRALLKAPILNIPKSGCLNLHGSLLPKYRGRSPINWAIIHGERETGVTLHYMTERPDDGDIVCQMKVPIGPEDTARVLNRRLVEAAGMMLDEYLPQIECGCAPRVPQDHGNASYFSRRSPDDGAIDWKSSSGAIRNLVRAVTRPYPGAFTYRGDTKIYVWEVAQHGAAGITGVPGRVHSIDPLVVQCAHGALEVRTAQVEGDIYRSGAQLATEISLVPGTRLGPRTSPGVGAKTRVLILGVNGFIGSALTERLLASGRYEVHGMDLNHHSIRRFHGERDFYFHEGDIGIHREWIEYHVKKCDVVVPLIAIATPVEYVRNPLHVFELDFEENLRIVRYCVKYNKRVVFPSTSEVYGMCDDPEFSERTSRLVLGPVHKQRWIYSCSKQLLDRVIWAYGQSQSLRFTLFRPFNWIGPRLDSLDSARIGSSRAITQLILNLVEGTPIQLVDGGRQKRCFTDVRDGIECLFRIIENEAGRCDAEIVNIGNPDNEASILELAALVTRQFEAHPLRGWFPPCAGMRTVESRRYYGDGYEDLRHRRPSIANATRLVGWRPAIGLEDAVAGTLDFFLRESTRSLAAASPECMDRGAFRLVADEPRTACG